MAGRSFRGSLRSANQKPFLVITIEASHDPTKTTFSPSAFSQISYASAVSPLLCLFFFPIIRNQQYIKGFPPYLDTASQTCPSPPHLLGQLILVKTPKKPFTPDLSSKRVSLGM